MTFGDWMAGLPKPERLAVIGDPINHSLSPVMQGAALAAAHLPWSYEAVHVTSSALAAWVRRVRSGEFVGFNVTIPHKTAMVAYVDERASSVERTGAVNTVVRDGIRLTGHNTDVAGFAATLSGFQPSLLDRVAVVLGAGGAARAVVAHLLDMRAQVVIINRSPTRAEALVEALAAGGSAVAVPERDPAAARYLEAASLVVNATSLGMGAQANDSPLVPGTSLRPQTIAIDLVYGHDTPFLLQARVAGCRTADGAEMLVQQGAESFRLWTGQEPNLNAMRDALDARSGERHHAEISHRG